MEEDSINNCISNSLASKEFGDAKEANTALEQRKRAIFIINPAEVSKNGSLIPPLGLALITATLKKVNYTPKVIDMTFDNDFKQICDINATNGIYFISFSTTLVDRVEEVIRIIRSKDRAAFIMGGGAHPSARKEKIFDDLDLDAISLGEVKISEIVEALHSEDWAVKFAEIKGIIYKHNGKIYINKPVDEWESLEDIPLPDYNSFPIEKYFKTQGFRAVSITTSRGCPYRCTFCQPILISLFGPKVRFSPVKRAVDEIEYVVKNFNVDFLIFSDDTFAFSQQRVIDMCKEIVKRKIPVLWRCQTRVGLKRETLEWMRKAGCFLIAFGVESGSQKILDNVNKDATVEMAIETFKNCKEIGMLTHAFLMIGNVGETEETINETINLIKKIKPFSYNISIATPYPGTYLYKYAKENSILMDPKWGKYDHILSGSVAKFSTFELEELPKIKKEMEQLINKEQETFKDIVQLFFDWSFIWQISRVVKHNPTMPFRMLRLVIRAFTLKGYGYRMSNPMTGA